jgi:predicted nucleic-acid-binding protein
MKKYIIDTNCLISFLTNRDETQRAIVTPYFDTAAQFQCNLIILDIVIMEFVYVLSRVYRTDPVIVRDIVSTILHTPGLTADHNTDLDTAIRLWPDKIKDFGDALIASHAFHSQIPVLTLDHSLMKELADCNIETEIIHR